MEPNIYENTEYQQERRKVEKFFDDAEDWRHATPDDHPIKSPSGRWVLHIDQVSTKPGCWNYSRGVVVAAENKENFHVVYRNYGAFPYLFVENHPTTGNDYLICGEDYQGYTIINLTKKTRQTYIPEAWLKGHGFCWAQYEFDEEKLEIVVDGCYWACPYEKVGYDFTHPDTVPLSENWRDYEDDEDEEEEDDGEESD